MLMAFLACFLSALPPAPRPAGEAQTPRGVVAFADHPETLPWDQGMSEARKALESQGADGCEADDERPPQPVTTKGPGLRCRFADGSVVSGHGWDGPPRLTRFRILLRDAKSCGKLSAGLRSLGFSSEGRPDNPRYQTKVIELQGRQRVVVFEPVCWPGAAWHGFDVFLRD